MMSMKAIVLFALVAVLLISLKNVDARTMVNSEEAKADKEAETTHIESNQPKAAAPSMYQQWLQAMNPWRYMQALWGVNRSNSTANPAAGLAAMNPMAMGAFNMAGFPGFSRSALQDNNGTMNQVFYPVNQIINPVVQVFNVTINLK